MQDSIGRRCDLSLLAVLDALMAERSLAGAAARLGMTRSRVSRALARLRAELSDPLVTRVGHRLQPSPFALEIATQVRGVLQGAERLMRPATPFDPATSTRIFRVAAPDFSSGLFPLLLRRLGVAAPNVTLEWLGPREYATAELSQARLDLSVNPMPVRLPADILAEPIGALHWCCYARRNHPAASRWSAAAWSRWPHVMVGVGDQTSNPVSRAAARSGVSRRIGARVPNFAAVAPLLAQTDLIATLPSSAMTNLLDRYDLVALPSPVPLDPIPHVMMYSAEQAQDSGTQWLKAHLREAFVAATGGGAATGGAAPMGGAAATGIRST